MVKCSNCGVEVAGDLENCPNCGNTIVKSESIEKGSDIKKCSKCGAELNESNSFCSSCGSPVEVQEDTTLKCENCGSELPENTLFCTVCGTKVNQVKKISKKHCPNCGMEIDENATFCEECGTNLSAVEKNKPDVVFLSSFVDKINLNIIMKPAIVAIVASLILSFIGLIIGFSWLSFIIAIILSAGFFGAAIDNEANSIVFGLIVGLILGLLETPLVEFAYGAFVAGFYEGFFGGHLILIVVLGIVMAYVSNMYLKETILGLTDNFKGML